MQVSPIILTMVVALVFSVTFARADEPKMPLHSRFAELPEGIREAYANHVALQSQQREADGALRETIARSQANGRSELLRYIADLVAFSFGDEIAGNQNESRWAAGMVVISTPADLILDAIVPELAAGGRFDKILKMGDKDLREYLEHGTKTKVPAIDQYLSYLSTHRFDEAKGLVHYLLETYPERAFVGLIALRADELDDRTALLASHHEIWVVLSRMDDKRLGIAPDDRARSAIDYLSKHTDWWIRLYAAEIIRRHPEFRVAPIVDRLKKDENELVRKTVTASID
jgi:hypothetical protein